MSMQAYRRRTWHKISCARSSNVLLYSQLMITLDEWDQGNGGLAHTTLKPGQDICAGGAEKILRRGTGGCRLIVLFLEIPPTEAR